MIWAVSILSPSGPSEFTSVVNCSRLEPGVSRGERQMNLIHVVTYQISWEGKLLLLLGVLHFYLQWCVHV